MIRRSGQRGPQPAQRLLAVARGLDLEAVGAELVGEQDEQVRVVVDDAGSAAPHAAVARRTAAQHGPRIAAGSAAPRRVYGRLRVDEAAAVAERAELVVRAAGVADVPAVAG